MGKEAAKPQRKHAGDCFAPGFSAHSWKPLWKCWNPDWKPFRMTSGSGVFVRLLLTQQCGAAISASHPVKRCIKAYSGAEVCIEDSEAGTS